MNQFFKIGCRYATNPTGLGADAIFAFTKRKKRRKKEKKLKSHRENVKKMKDHISDFSVIDFKYQLRPEGMSIATIYFILNSNMIENCTND